jgi:hypothetical protein
MILPGDGGEIARAQPVGERARRVLFIHLGGEEVRHSNSFQSIPAQAGIQSRQALHPALWVPACAGMLLYRV